LGCRPGRLFDFYIGSWRSTLLSAEAAELSWCYNESMARSARVSVAILLALALPTVPLLLDQCDSFCDHPRAASLSEPTCHHTSAPAARVGHQATRCGHDHEATVTTLSDSAVPTHRAVASVVVISAQVADATVVVSRITASAGPPRDPLSRRLSRSLRI
jgi:hypothetical protein